MTVMVNCFIILFFQAVEEWRVIATNTDQVNVEFETPETSMQILEDLDISYRPLEFDYNKHKLLNSELKKLYTAITRARVNVWIFDEDKKKRAPMFDFLVKKNLVTVARLEEGFIPESFAVKSSKEDWNKRGNTFYKKNFFKGALRCAEIAGNNVLKQKCIAKLGFVQTLEFAQSWKSRKSRGSINEIYSNFKYCAFYFLKCGLIEDAKVSLYNAKEFNLFAMICEKQQNVCILICGVRKTPNFSPVNSSDQILSGEFHPKNSSGEFPLYIISIFVKFLILLIIILIFQD